MVKKLKPDKMPDLDVYLLPKFLFQGEYKELSNNARLLYMLIINRVQMSRENNWYNENKKDFYIIMPREEMKSLLNLSHTTIVKVMQELKDLELIEEEHVGLGEPNRLYIKSLI